MSQRVAKEAQNQAQLDTYEGQGPVQLGPWTSHIWRSDPRHLGFLLARYKFAAKMLTGKRAVMEIGCGDGFGMPVVLQTVETIHGIDLEPAVVEDAQARFAKEGETRCTFAVHDMTAGPLVSRFDAAYSLDVIEHIPPALEGDFMANINHSLREHGMCIMGTPNVAAKEHASEASRAGHINLKSAEMLRQLLLRYFHHALIFSMNDEIVHTGFSPMAHYLIGVGVEVKEARYG